MTAPKFSFGSIRVAFMHKKKSAVQDSAQKLFDHAGVKFNGDNPWDIQVHNSNLYARILKGGSLGLGESYIDGWWDCEQMDVLFNKVIGADLSQRMGWQVKLQIAGRLLVDMLTNPQTVARAHQVADAHYNLGNDLFEDMLDPTMNYSCGYWKTASNLEQAQIDKMDLICRKLKLSAGMKVLDIGCGWGGLAEYMAREYGVEVDGLTISNEQQALAQKRVKGLPIDIRLQDYRHLTGRYDRIVSVGMFEHVGRKNYRQYFEKATELLDPQGYFLLHTIGTELTGKPTDAFIQKYIFPNGKIPDRFEINDASMDLLRLEDWHNFGPDYDKTLMVWLERFEAAWPELKSNYDERFYRMWRYYLTCCAGYFRCRRGQLWQLVYAHPDTMHQPYISER